MKFQKVYRQIIKEQNQMSQYFSKHYIAEDIGTDLVNGLLSICKAATNKISEVGDSLADIVKSVCSTPDAIVTAAMNATTGQVNQVANATAKNSNAVSQIAKNAPAISNASINQFKQQNQAILGNKTNAFISAVMIAIATIKAATKTATQGNVASGFLTSDKYEDIMGLVLLSHPNTKTKYNTVQDAINDVFHKDDDKIYIYNDDDSWNPIEQIAYSKGLGWLNSFQKNQKKYYDDAKKWRDEFVEAFPKYMNNNPDKNPNPMMVRGTSVHPNDLVNIQLLKKLLLSNAAPNGGKGIGKAAPKAPQGGKGPGKTLTNKRPLSDEQIKELRELNIKILKALQRQNEQNVLAPFDQAVKNNKIAYLGPEFRDLNHIKQGFPWTWKIISMQRLDDATYKKLVAHLNTNFEAAQRVPTRYKDVVELKQGKITSSKVSKAQINNIRELNISILRALRRDVNDKSLLAPFDQAVANKKIAYLTPEDRKNKQHIAQGFPWVWKSISIQQFSDKQDQVIELLKQNFELANNTVRGPYRDSLEIKNQI